MHMQMKQEVWWGATKLLGKAMSTLRTAKWHPLGPFATLHITQSS